MNTIKNIFLAIGGLILAFFTSQINQKTEEGKFINAQNDKTIINKNNVFNMSDDIVT